MRTVLLFVFLVLNSANLFSQTTDLAISVEAQDLFGNDISQAYIFEEFQYLVTISNIGGSTQNAIFSQTINGNVSIVSVISQNATNGASLITNFNIDQDNIITGTISNFPAASSIEVLVTVIAPEIIGGIATEASITPNNETTDNNDSNNISIISIDIVDVVIDFTVTQEQVQPEEGTPITAWDDTVTYQFTITNNSAIAYPLDEFYAYLSLVSPQIFGEALVEVLSVNCIESTNGTACISNFNMPNEPVLINNATGDIMFSTSNTHIFQPNSAITIEAVYKYLEPECAIQIDNPLEVESGGTLVLNHSNMSSNESNLIQTELIEATQCQQTDLCIETTQLSPATGQPISWGEEMVFETTICNNGPLEVNAQADLRNVSNENASWEIISVECIENASTLPCNLLSFNIGSQNWVSNIFNIPVGEFYVVETTVRFLEPDCVINSGTIDGIVRSGIAIETNGISDSYFNNNFNYNYFDLSQGNVELCDTSDIEVTKTQIYPEPPEGSDIENTTAWATPITYEITVSNLSETDITIELKDFINSGAINSASLQSVECISTTGTAQCFSIDHANLNVELDGIPDNDGNPDLFWEILPEDGWALPANSSVTFLTEVLWSPKCATPAITAENKVTVYPNENLIEPNTSNNEATVTTYFAPCIDLVVQTFPEFPTVTTNQPFNWVVDVTNSVTSSEAINVLFENTLEAPFTIVGTPTCQVTSGNATCINSFTVSDNFISGIIPNMEANSTVRVFIPVEAPSYGGVFINTSEATPNIVNNEELTPETNISISSVRVSAPNVMKSFTPEEIYVGEESILTFTITNISSNEAQNNISFTDTFPENVLINGDAFWETSNGCTATFSGNIGTNTFQVTNLTFPEGVSSCTFAIPVTSNTSGFYTNSSSNFTNQVNIDTSQAHATLNVLEDTSDVDVAVEKTVSQENASIGDTITFTITATNLGTTEATNIEIYDMLPNGYNFVDSSTSSGVYNFNSYVWSIPSLTPNQIETLTITAEIVSANNLINIALLQALDQPDRNTENNEDSASVSVDGCLVIPELITPNNDGFNDALVIPCLEDYTNHIKIFNRYGVLVFETSNYLNNWSGTSNQGLLHKKDNKLPVGTYYYILNIEGQSNPIIGWIYLNY
ncbi:gliding motility-associated C-terminal domain-containing protein [Mangrovimonas cancribranchiae]|uniref:Gliding motility-associated C-terminal domain-containing protein n=1 Tax=Mangrovimonas cancribranchiae TaxID=3080055 RepID=A0AAU6P6M4_9FLAO